MNYLCTYLYLEGLLVYRAVAAAMDASSNPPASSTWTMAFDKWPPQHIHSCSGGSEPNGHVHSDRLDNLMGKSCTDFYELGFLYLAMETL